MSAIPPTTPAELEARLETAVRERLVPLVVELGLGEFWKRYQRLLEAERWSPETRAERCWSDLRELLEHAEDSVPLYRERLRSAGLEARDVESPAELARLPYLDKRDLVAAFPDRITSRASERGEWRYRSTSGTAYRVMIVTDRSARQWRYAQHLRSLDLAAGWAPGKRQTILRTEACLEACAGGGEEAGAGADALPVEREWPPFGFAPLLLQETVVHARELRSTAVRPVLLEGYLRQISEARPYLLRGMPTFLLLLARHLQRSGQAPPPVARIVVQDALAPPSMKREIAEAFGCPVSETWGSSELGSVAAETEAGEGLAIAPGLFWVEVLRLDGTPAPVGEAGIVVVSAVTNRAMPLVRYRLGDVGRWLPGGGGRIRIEGRERESLWVDERLVTTAEIYEALAPVPGLEHFQLVERGDARLELRAVTAGAGFASDDAVDRLRALLGAGFEVEVRPVPSLRAEESGKFAFVHALERRHHPREA